MRLKPALKGSLKDLMLRLRLDDNHIRKDAPAKCMISVVAAIVLTVWGVYGHSHGLDVHIPAILLPVAIAAAIVNGMLWNPTSAKWLVEERKHETD